MPRFFVSEINLRDRHLHQQCLCSFVCFCLIMLDGNCEAAGVCLYSFISPSCGGLDGLSDYIPCWVMGDQDAHELVGLQNYKLHFVFSRHRFLGGCQAQGLTMIFFVGSADSRHKMIKLWQHQSYSLVSFIFRLFLVISLTRDVSNNLISSVLLFYS